MKKPTFVIEFVGPSGIGKSYLQRKVLGAITEQDWIGIDVSDIVVRVGDCTCSMPKTAKRLYLLAFVLEKPHIIIASIITIVSIKPTLSDGPRILRTLLITQWRLYVARRNRLGMAVLSEGLYQRFQSVFGRTQSSRMSDKLLLRDTIWKRMLLYPDIVVFLKTDRDVTLPRATAKINTPGSRRERPFLRKPASEVRSSARERTLAELDLARQRGLLDYYVFDNSKDDSYIDPLVAFIRSHQEGRRKQVKSN